MKYLIVISLTFLIFSCARDKNNVDFQNLPTFTEQGVNVVIEIPAGTNHKIEINKKTGAFENDSINGEIRVIKFLPYPGNYGFIPSTHMDEKLGGDGDALDVLIIAESVPTGSVMEIIPIASFLLKDEGALDTKIIGVPIDSGLNVMQVYAFQDLMIEHQAAKKMIEDWFLNYDGPGIMESLGWRDEKYTMDQIKKWSKGN